MTETELKKNWARLLMNKKELLGDLFRITRKRVSLIKNKENPESQLQSVKADPWT